MRLGYWLGTASPVVDNIAGLLMSNLSIVCMLASLQLSGITVARHDTLSPVSRVQQYCF